MDGVTAVAVVSPRRSAELAVGVAVLEAGGEVEGGGGLADAAGAGEDDDAGRGVPVGRVQQGGQPGEFGLPVGEVGRGRRK
ncbi:hypothetical protein AB6O49_07825 [Streptomyces sp. SBR177]